MGGCCRGHRLFPTLSLPAGAALAGLPLPEGGEETGADTHVGTGEAGAGICAPGKTPQCGTGSQHHGADVEAVCNMWIPWSPQGQVRVAGLPHRLSGPAVPLCTLPSEPNLSLNLLCHPAPLHPIAAPTSDPSTAFRLCPACCVPCLPIQFPPGIELTCCLLPSSRSSIKMLRSGLRQRLSRLFPSFWHSLPPHWHGPSFGFPSL